jgi:hypothetical protein
MRAMLTADPSLLRLRTSQGEYGEKPPSSFHIYQWTIGPNLTPLQVAAKFGQRETLRVMEEFASAADRLLLACHEADGDAARAIVAADPGIVGRLQPPDSQALANEAWAANGPAVELMMELGFDPAVASGPRLTGGNALHNAAFEGSVGCVTAILNYPAGRALLTARDRTYGGVPLSWCRHGSLHSGNPNADHGAVARLLIDAGAPVDAAMADVDASDAFHSVIVDALDR